MTDLALSVATSESTCDHKAVNVKSNDYGLFQHHNYKPKDLDDDIKQAYRKYQDGRIGANNWSAWYAVCNPHSRQLYKELKCK